MADQKKKRTTQDKLNPGKAPKTRKELLDYDYIHKLNPEQKDWLGQFTEEWAGGAVKKTKAKIRKDGTKIRGSGKVRKDQIHNTEELAKDCFDRNNRRNIDVLGVASANRLTSEISAELKNQDGWYITNPDLTEDALIKGIDRKEDLDEDLLTFEEFKKVKDNLTPEMLLFYLAYFDL